MNNKRKKTLYEKIFKRPLDFFISLLSIIILSPIIVIVAILVKIKLGGPILFKQERPGKNEKIITVYKFRSMTNEKDSDGNLLSDEIRLTKFGKFLRSSSLDELPQLFNILKGDMSIIGPRPQMRENVIFMSDTERRRHEVRPGLTGLAQINGRNGLKWSERLKLDLDYIQKITFWGDIKIFLKTILIVLKKDGISSNGKEQSLPIQYWEEQILEKIITKEQAEKQLKEFRDEQIKNINYSKS